MNPSKKFFHGWAIAGSCFIILFLLRATVGNIVAVSQATVSSDMGWSRGELSMAIAAATLSMILAPLLVGAITDMVGARKTVAACCLLSGVGLIFLGSASNLWHFALSLATVSLAVAVFIPIAFVLVNWFNRKRGLVIGLVLMGMYIGDMARGQTITLFSDSLGWRKSLAISGVVIVFITLPLVLFIIRNRPSEMGLFPDGNEPDTSQREVSVEHTLGTALRSSTFWLIAIGVFFAGLAISPIVVYSPELLKDLGHFSLYASFVGGLCLTGLMILSSPLFGLLADKWGSRKAFVICACMSATGIVMLMLASPLWVLALFALFFWLAHNGPLVLTPLLAADYHGLSRFGFIYGLLTLFNGLGASIGSGLIGIVHSNLLDSGMAPIHAYQIVFAPLIAVALMSAYCISRLKRTPLNKAVPIAAESS